MITYKTSKSWLMCLAWLSLSSLLWSDNSELDTENLYSSKKVLATTGHGLTGRYYSTTNLSNLVLTRVDANIDLDLTNQAPAPGMPNTNYSIEWTGFIQPLYSELYTIQTLTCDGIIVTINHAAVINNWTYHGSQLNTGQIQLQAGVKYPITVTFFHGPSPHAVCELSWSSKSQKLQIVPVSQLYTTGTPTPPPPPSPPPPPPSPPPPPPPPSPPPPSPPPPPPPPSPPPPASSCPNAQPLTGWKLIWQDEFTTPSLDLTKWSYIINGDGGGNNELQYYTNSPANSYIQNGIFTIKAIKQQMEGRAYTSARVHTQGKFSFTYGRVDVCAQLPIGQGLWPGIWMLPEDSSYGTWPLSGEIDIMEMIGQNPNTVFGSLNYGDPWPGNKYVTKNYTLPSGNFSQGYHVFSIEWSPNQIQWFVDGNLYATQTPSNLGQCYSSQACPNGAPCACPWRFNKPFYLLLNVAVGGSLPGPPNNSTVFPQTMNVHYVRVYQK